MCPYDLEYGSCLLARLTDAVFYGIIISAKEKEYRL